MMNQCTKVLQGRQAWHLPFGAVKMQLALVAPFCVAITWFVDVCDAQSVCLPLPRLLSTMPMGGKIGSEFELNLTTENIDGEQSLLFSDPKIVSRPKLNEEGKPEPNKFLVSIASDCPTGLYEARTMSKLGISSSRIFSVNSFPESISSSTNTTLTSPVEIKVNSICNAVATAKSVDHYFFDALSGHRYVLDCSARGIDSKLDPVMVIADSEGRDLLVERKGDRVDFVAKQDGRHMIKVHELTFRGGPAFFYRLCLQEIGLDGVVPALPVTRGVNTYSWPPHGLVDQVAQLELEPNNVATNAQKISLPFDISGTFYPAADVDLFEFVASKGETWWIEVASERMGRPTDPSVLVQHIGMEAGKETITEVAEFSDIASPVKPSSNGYAYDGPPYDGGSTDILGKLEIKHDGVHRLQLSDLFGGTRTDARNAYRLIIRKASPDFALAAWGLHMELRNGDRNALSKPLALRAGATVALEVIAFRRDGFASDIQFQLNGLPSGVTAQSVSIPTGKSRGYILITANQEAPNSLSNLALVGCSKLEGLEIVRPVQMAQMVWPVPDSWGEIPSTRLVDGTPLSVSNAEYSPITIAASTSSVFQAKIGEKLTIPMTHTRRSDFSGSVLQLKAFGDGFDRIPPFNIALDSESSQATVDLEALKTPPGEYTLAFYGAAVAKYKNRKDAPSQDTVEIIVTEPITIRVQQLEPQ